MHDASSNTAGCDGTNPGFVWANNADLSKVTLQSPSRGVGGLTLNNQVPSD
jgi:hypothetical protein